MFKTAQKLTMVLGLMMTLSITLGCVTSAFAKPPKLQTVPYVDLKKYAGRWYEIASFPQRFSKGCVATTADYSLRADGDIDVVNTCRMYTLDGEINQATGKAWVDDKITNAKLKVRFFWPFSGKYWIIELGQNYEYAVVGHPDRDYLWILSRTPQMDGSLYQDLINKLVNKHRYDISKLQKTLQP